MVSNCKGGCRNLVRGRVRQECEMRGRGAKILFVHFPIFPHILHCRGIMYCVLMLYIYMYINCVLVLYVLCACVVPYAYVVHIEQLHFVLQFGLN